MNKRWIFPIVLVLALIVFAVYVRLAPENPNQPAVSNLLSHQPLEGEGVITILYTGNTQSYLEPCGCYPGQSGGIARRGSLVERIREEQKSVLLVDAGGIFEGKTSLDRLRAKTNMEAMSEINYDAILLSPTELQFGNRFLEGITTELSLPLISTNNPPLWESGGLVQSSAVKTLKGNRLIVLGASYVPNQSLPHLIETLSRRITAQKEGHKATVILLSALEGEDNRRIVRQLKEIDLLISMQPKARGNQYEEIGNTVVAYCKPHGETLGKINLKFDDQGQIIGYHLQELFMDETVPDNQAVRSILEAFYDNVATDEALQALGEPLFTSESLEKDGESHYVGSDACSGCHQPEFEQWRSTRHAIAFNTLLKVQKHFHPDCVSCHVVGFGYETGYAIQEDQDHFRDVGCETCHGPGGSHITQPSRRNIRGKVEKRICLECHNQKHSPGFEDRFKIALPKVDHSRTAPDILDKLVTEIKQKEKTDMELYVMSLCPFGNEVERQIIPIVKRYQTQVGLKINYIAEDLGAPANNPTRFDSLHGIPEVWENIRQLVIAKYYPAVFLDYLHCRTEDYRDYEGWKQCADRFGIDAEKVERLTHAEEGYSLLEENIKEQPLSITDSPTLIVNGTVYEGEDFGIDHCSGGKRSQDEYDEIVPIITDYPHWVANPKAAEFSAEQTQYLNRAREAIYRAGQQGLSMGMLKPDELERWEELRQIPKRLTEMLRQDPDNPYLTMFLGEAYRAVGRTQRAIKLHAQQGFILNNNWLIAGPWSTENNYLGLTAFKTVLPPEKEIEFSKNYKTTTKVSKQNQWVETVTHWIYPDFKTVQSYIDLRSALKASTMACYALSYVKVKQLKKVQMRIGAVGVLKVWGNDKLLYLNPTQKPFARIDEYIIPVEFKSGLNKILVKVVRHGGKKTGFYLRLTDENGKPLDDVEAVLPAEANLLPRQPSMSWRIISEKS